MNSKDVPSNPPGPIFIGLSGKKQVGKDTSAEILTSLLGRRGVTVTTTAFAATLKDMCVDILGLPANGVWGTDEEKNQPSHIMWDTLPDDIRIKHSDNQEPRTGPMTNREVLQILGTDIFREMLYWNVWVDVPFRRSWETEIVIIADVRFPNEKEAIEHHGGVVLRLTRDTGMEGDIHASETALDNTQFDFSYDNNSTIVELAEYLDRFLENVLDGSRNYLRPCNLRHE